MRGSTSPTGFSVPKRIVSSPRLAKNLDAKIFSPETCHGALANYITTADEKNFQPMNVTFGLLPPFENRVPKKLRKEKLSERALNALENFIKSM